LRALYYHDMLKHNISTPEDSNRCTHTYYTRFGLTSFGEAYKCNAIEIKEESRLITNSLYMGIFIKLPIISAQKDM